MKIDDPTDLRRAAVLLRQLYTLVGTPIPDSIAVARLSSPNELDRDALKRNRLSHARRVKGLLNFNGRPTVGGALLPFAQELTGALQTHLPESLDIQYRLQAMSVDWRYNRLYHHDWRGRTRVGLGDERNTLTDKQFERLCTLRKRLAEVAFAWGGGPLTPFVLDTPKIRLNEARQLHSQQSKAIEWSDGFGYAFIQGTPVPDAWVAETPKFPTPINALSWRNTDQRRVLVELMGWNSLMKSIHAREIDANPDPMIGTLYAGQIPIKETTWRGTSRQLIEARFLKVQCGTGREFMIPVPTTCSTALEAQAWTWGHSAGTFRKPEVRT